MFPGFILTHLCEAQRFKCTKTCRSSGAFTIWENWRSPGNAWSSCAGKGLVGGMHLIDSDRSCKNAELKSLRGQNNSWLKYVRGWMGANLLFYNFRPAQGNQEKPRSAGTLQMCRETGHFGHEFWFVAVTSSVHTDFSPASLGKQEKHSSLRQGVLSPGAVGWPWRAVPCLRDRLPLNETTSVVLLCTAWLGWDRGRPTRGGRKAQLTQLFLRTALFSELRSAAVPCALPTVSVLLPVGRLCASLFLLLRLKGHALKLDFSSVWMPMLFNLWMLQYILLCSFKSGRAQVLYGRV